MSRGGWGREDIHEGGHENHREGQDNESYLLLIEGTVSSAVINAYLTSLCSGHVLSTGDGSLCHDGEEGAVPCLRECSVGYMVTYTTFYKYYFKKRKKTQKYI